MSKPFEFEGVKVWRDRVDCIVSLEPGEVLGKGTYTWGQDSPIHAFLEAERDVWHEDGDGFRKGRWTVEEVKEETGTYVRHDDLDGYLYYYQPSWPDTGMLKPGQVDFHARKAVLDFLAWHAANTQPEEPTGLGYVFKANTPRGHTYTHVGAGQWFDDLGVPFAWREIHDEWTPGGVLSQGVTS